MSFSNWTRRDYSSGWLGVLCVALLSSLGSNAYGACANTIKADVVALDQPFMWNRLGAWHPQGMIYALKHDVESIDGTTLSPGNVKLKAYKRPRPIVLRVNEGDCLEITFTNLLSNPRNPNQVHPPNGQDIPPLRPDEQPATRTASIHVIGMQLVGGIADDGSNVGQNTSSLVAPGGSKTYKLYAEREGTHHMYSAAAMTGGEGDGGSLNSGLFGAVNVEPKGSVWYRSQVTAEDISQSAETVIQEPAGGGNGVANTKALKGIMAGVDGVANTTAQGVIVAGVDGVANTTAQGVIVGGADCVANTTAAVDDIQVIAVGDPALPGDVIVTPGPNGTLDTVPGGDDSESKDIQAKAVGDPAGPGEEVVVTPGPHGFLATVPGGDDVLSNDVQVIAVGDPAGPGDVIVTPGPHGVLATVPLDDDVLIEDVQVIAVGAAAQPGDVIVRPGPHGFLATVPGGDDEKEKLPNNTTAGGHPIIDYNAAYPPNHPDRPSLPIFNILQGNKIVHSDLTAIIVPLANTYPPNPAYEVGDGKREDPFREFTIIYHDEIGAVQAFDIFEDPDFDPTLHSVRDAFAINYGTGGIGAEILANRLGVGPMWDCTECKYEEFFLSAWVVGDPAMVVDVPANVKDNGGNLLAGAKATKAFYPDDPSNVYHSYLKDHCKFRLTHGGSKEHHIHHLHAHQWLHSPDSDNSAYLDSQAFGPGAAFTLEMVYNGSGNRNQTVGDSIFHCHFYPHFAQGMWAMWRVHDVFEDGSRLLPDGEIVAGTPIPAVVPLPGLAMAPMPQAEVHIVPADANNDGTPDSSQVEVTFVDLDGDGTADPGNPGYPFFIPGVAGHRPPHPPLDTIHDGGLPRHVVISDPASEVVQVQTVFDFTREIHKMKAQELPEGGTAVELAAMAFHAVREHDSYKQDGTAGKFIANGLPPVAGAPFADPCITDTGGVPAYMYTRTYKAAIIQLDGVFNKVGWHFPQLRMASLWEDVQDFFSGTKAPEPLFFRAHSGDCVEYHLTNLTPNIYELDDFQVRTPTDVMGQHIHLVKFDVTSSDGSANGWNYEDASFSPDEVRERIHALNDFFAEIEDPDDPNYGKSALLDADGNPQPKLVATAIPFFGAGPDGKFLGAQTTVQRWYADTLKNIEGDDRTLRTVFTHDHFGPSTHQHPGLYAGLLIEPKYSDWYMQDGTPMGTRDDGGPTSWRADIHAGADSYREYMLELADFQLAYRAGSHPELPSAGGPVFPDPWDVNNPRTSGQGFSNITYAINPPAKEEVGLPFLLEGPLVHEFSEAVSADDPGTMSVNYRNEPIPLRIVDDPYATYPKQVAGIQGDLSHVYRSDILNRAVGALNDPPNLWPYSGGSPSVGAKAGDPFTPLLRAYETDKIQVRVMVGATEEGHNFAIHGVKWLFEPDWTNSGYRNSQMMGISEHFEFEAPTDVVKGGGNFADYLYQAGASVDDQWNGIWGLLRVYDGSAGLEPDLLPLPNNPDGKAPPFANHQDDDETNDFAGPCPKTDLVPSGNPKNPRFRYDVRARTYSVYAVAAKDVLPDGAIEYNSREVHGGPLKDPTGIMFILKEDLATKGPNKGKLKPGVPIEPLVLRANAGDCIQVRLENHLPATLHGPDPAFPNQTEDLAGFNTMVMLVDNFNANQVRPSNEVGLHAQLVNYDILKDGGNGVNVGFNVTNNPSSGTPQTIGPGGIAKYTWYAGDVSVGADGIRVATPIEYGAINLSSSDPIKHSNKGAVAALIIEPEGSTWQTDWELGINKESRLAATVTPPAPAEPFREFVVFFQNDINLRYGDGTAVPLMAETEDPEDSGHKAFNYKTEPAWFRLGFAADATLGQTADRTDLDTFVSNSVVGGDPETPVFTAAKGTPVRFRVLEPGGHARNHVFAVHGHAWQLLPYINDSTQIGDNPLSMWEGARMGHGPSNHFDAVLQNGAGGAFGVPGDYLFRDQASFYFDGGLWGILRVTNGSE